MTDITKVVLGVFAAVVVSTTGPFAHATISFEAPLENGYGANAEFPAAVGDVATDGSGVWIAATHGDLNCCDGDVVYRRSVDGGRTWAPTVQLNNESATGLGADYSVQLAASSSRWLATWRFVPYDGNVTTPEGILLIRSDDGGSTWTNPVSIGAETADGVPTELVTDGMGTWILAWIGQSLPGEVHVSRSIDDGQTWTTSSLGTSATSDWTLTTPDVATDGAGRWTVVWHVDSGSASRAYFATSLDNGLNWSGAAPIDAGAATDAIQRYPDVLCDGIGKWAVVWSDRSAETIHLSRSADASSWSVPESIHRRGPAVMTMAAHDSVAFASRGDGDWIVAWSTISVPKIEIDMDVVFTHSPDAGATWTPVAALNLNAIRDHGLTNSLARRNEYISDLAADASGAIVAQYAGTFHCCASDYTYLTYSVPDCPASPPTNCTAPAAAGEATLSLRNELLFRDAVAWKWRGPAAAPTAFGNPLASSDFAFRVYRQDVDGDLLVYEGEARAGASCGEKSCWRQRTGGYSFRDSQSLIGSTRQIAMRSAASGTRLSFSGGGPALLAPTLPIDGGAQLLAVLRNLENGECWQSSFSSPSVNELRGYRAESD